MIRESAYIVVERNTIWEGEAASEPYEVGWAKEAILYFQVLDGKAAATTTQLRVQLSPDGVRWCDEGTVIDLPTVPGQVAFARVSHFGGWLRLAASIADGVRLPVLISAHLKA